MITSEASFLAVHNIWGGSCIIGERDIAANAVLKISICPSESPEVHNGFIGLSWFWGKFKVMLQPIWPEQAEL